MAVDYTGTHAGVPTYAPADTTMLYQHTKSRISALVHYFNLHDVKARGKYNVHDPLYSTSGNPRPPVAIKS